MHIHLVIELLLQKLSRHHQHAVHIGRHKFFFPYIAVLDEPKFRVDLIKMTPTAGNDGDVLVDTPEIKAVTHPRALATTPEQIHQLPLVALALS